MWRAVLAEPTAFAALSCMHPAPLLGVMLYPCTFEIIFSFYCKFSALGSCLEKGNKRSFLEA